MRETLGDPRRGARVAGGRGPAARSSRVSCSDRKLAARPVGIEETVRFFIPDMLAHALPGAKIVSANPVVRGCRMIKTPAELALMQRATDVTIAAYRWTYPRVEKGMTGRDIGALMDAATDEAGRRARIQPGPDRRGRRLSARHASRHRVADGEIVLMDCGCTVQGYQSDVSRTFVFGSASKEQRMVWDQVASGPADRASPRRGSARRRAASMTRCGGYYEGVRLRPGLQAARPVRTAPGTASGSTGTSRSTWCAARRRSWRRACAFRTNPASTFPASSACGWRIAST